MLIFCRGAPRISWEKAVGQQTCCAVGVALAVVLMSPGQQQKWADGRGRLPGWTSLAGTAR